LPGRIAQSIRKAKSSNPVLMVDEIDKIGSSGKGDPAAALLEVLDPKQNANFYDNYLGVTFDISNVMFIATCNDLSAIPGPLRDRMEVIQIPGYTSYEKLQIATKHLLPKLIINMGLENQDITIDESCIQEVIKSYTRECGVRDLERCLGKLCAKFARAMVEENIKSTFTKDNLSNYLGAKKHRAGSFTFNDKIGVTNGLAWTSMGGELLQVEAILMPGTGKLTLTGQLGDVMKESAQAAVSYARSKAQNYKINEKMFKNYDLHVHIPSGAIPKDGPSAGVTLLSSILSVFTQRPVDSKCAMTGELNLQGSILPIGGLKEKILAAQQYGLKKVFIPELNRKELEEERSVLDLTGIELLFVNNVEELLAMVLLQPNT
jgi:ATP-dependent Lon protease